MGRARVAASAPQRFVVVPPVDDPGIGASQGRCLRCALRPSPAADVPPAGRVARDQGKPQCASYAIVMGSVARQGGGTAAMIHRWSVLTARDYKRSRGGAGGKTGRPSVLRHEPVRDARAVFCTVNAARSYFGMTTFCACRRSAYTREYGVALPDLLTMHPRDRCCGPSKLGRDEPRSSQGLVVGWLQKTQNKHTL